MNEKKKATDVKPAFAGATDFGAETDYIAPPPREVREAARSSGEAHGFVSDKPREPAPVPAPKVARPKPPARFPEQYNIRLRTEDRVRFDDFAYRHRIAKGEALRRLLDLAEADEARQEGRRSPERGKGDD